MTERNIQLWLQDIAGSIINIQNFVRGMDYDAFSNTLQAKHAVLHNFSILGEAVSKIPVDYKSMHPEVEWNEIKSFRNYVVHEYFGLDDSIVWSIIVTDLNPVLKKILH